MSWHRSFFSGGIFLASWSEWFKEAGKQGVDLESILPINLDADLKRLYSSGLPVYDLLRIPGKEYSKENSALKQFAEEHGRFWVRVYNRVCKGQRYSAFALEGMGGITSFIERIDTDLNDFDIQIFEWHENSFGGNILSVEESAYLEIAEGTQDLVGKSSGTFYHAQTNSLGRLCFEKEDVPSEVNLGAQRAFDYLRLSRNEFMQGYFEFIIAENHRVYFLDYKTCFR